MSFDAEGFVPCIVLILGTSACSSYQCQHALC